MIGWALIGMLALWPGAAVANTNVGTPPDVFSNVIFQGYATVDGVLSTGEWDKANWIPLDEDYHSSPPGVLIDLTNASWAAYWCPTANVIYVAITGIDTIQVMQAWTQWDGQDAVEIYVNARDDNADPYDANFQFAQQYVSGWDPVATSIWHVLGGGVVPYPPGTIPEAAVTIVSNCLSYEFKLRPYDIFNVNSPGSSTEIALEAGLLIGLDVTMNSRASPTNFGMLCENSLGGKFRDAGQLRDYRLVGPGKPKIGMVVEFR